MSLPLPLRDHSAWAVFGLGSTGVAVANLLARHGAHVLASDARATARPDALDPRVDVRLGGHDVGHATAVVFSPGMNPEWPETRANPALAPILERWRNRELTLVPELEVARAFFPLPTLAVGGTDGKSTTAALAHHLLRALGVDAFLCGNSWEPVSAVLARHPDAQAAVIEVSAFQLWEPHRFAADVALLTNIADDHLDHYGAIDDYVAAKAQLFRNARPGDAAILYGLDPRLIAMVPALRDRGLVTTSFASTPVDVGADRIARVEDDHLLVPRPDGHALRIPTGALRLPGRHNVHNALAALAAVADLADRLGVHADPIRLADGLASFRGLRHRVELVRERRGVRWYNDSKATNVHAALAGIRALPNPLVAIVGGVDKNLDLLPLIDALRERARFVVAIGQVRERFRDEANGCLNLALADSMDDAVRIADREARAGDAVLLAPASSSFDMFRSFEHRGEVFEQHVNALEP